MRGTHRRLTDRLREELDPYTFRLLKEALRDAKGDQGTGQIASLLDSLSASDVSISSWEHAERDDARGEP